jgi:hypothetical protein
MERSIFKPYFAKALLGVAILSVLLVLSRVLEQWVVF